MKNLKLLHISVLLQDLEADCYCSDHDGNLYVVSGNKLYCLPRKLYEFSLCDGFDLGSNEIKFIGIDYINDGELALISSSGELFIYDLYGKEVSRFQELNTTVQTYSWSPDFFVLVLLTNLAKSYTEEENAFSCRKRRFAIENEYDEEDVVEITPTKPFACDNNLILLSRTLAKIVEKNLCPEEFGESKPITVGWGSKETQFHGSEGKEAAKLKKIEPRPALAYDDGLPRVSWRSKEDIYYFVTSSIHPSKGFRQLRIWSKDGILQSTSEIKDGLEEPVAWRPGGNIACSQQDAAKHKIIFFEKNGLHHGEFALPFKPNIYRIKDLLWNFDGSVLLITAELIEQPSFTLVMLWTCGNYHWYLKQSFTLEKSEPEKPIILKWNIFHPHEFFCLDQTSRYLFVAKWALSISSSVSESNDAIVASIDNDSILITPFAQMVVPPPMCAYSYTLPSTVQNVCFAPKSQQFCCYLGNFKLAFFCKESTLIGSQVADNCKTKLIAAGGNGFRAKVTPYSFQGIFNLNLKGLQTFEFSLCHWTWIAHNKLLCVCSNRETSTQPFALMLIEADELHPEKDLYGSLITSFKWSVIGICTDKTGSVVAVQLADGSVLKLNIDLDKTDNITKESIHPWLCDNGRPLILKEPCLTMSVISISGKNYFLGLSETCNLYCNSTIILVKCTSYYIHDEYLLATTKDHVLKFFLIDWDLSDLKKSFDCDVQMQKIENNAKIIIAPHNDTKVILQMPRGNLETIHPRPLVLSLVCKHLDNLFFDKAFELCKIHRIDLNILFDHNPKIFLDHVKLFVEQLKSSNNLNLFLASLKNEDICETLYSLAYKSKNCPSKSNLEGNKIDIICDSIRDAVKTINDNKLFLTLIATYAKKTEPELEQALIILKEMKDVDPKGNQALIDNALNFLLYLVDVNELIDVALGTYDLEITVMVAQKSQKDPKEFLPFYNDLLKLEENYRKFKIDMHLRRFKKALQHISKCEENFDECLSLIRDQRLYIDSLNLFPSSSDRYKTVWKEYGNYLMDKRYYDEAGLVFYRCEDYERALMAYKESLNWQSMLHMAIELNYSNEKITVLCIEVAEKLKSNMKYVEASYILEHYVKDIEESIVTLIDGCEWNAALLQMSKYKRQDILETHLKPALLAHTSFLESQVKQLLQDFYNHNERLKVVRTQKQKDAEFASMMKQYDEELFDEGDSIADGASVTTSCTGSTQISGSIMTRKSSKSRRKQKLKKYRLKEGSPDEDLAHIAALSEIVTKIDNLKDNFLDTLKILVHFNYDNQAKLLQQEMGNLITLVESEMPEIWRPIETNSQNSEMKFGPDSTANSISAMLQSEKKNPASLRMDPELAQPPWRKIEMGLQMFK